MSDIFPDIQSTPQPAALLPGSAAVRILESITDAFFALDSGWCFTYVNTQAERLLARSREALLGRNVWEEFPEAVGSVFEREYRRAMGEQISASFEAFSSPLDTWFEVRAFPAAEGLSVFFHDVTEQVERRQREQFLTDLADRARRLSDPGDVIADALHSVGEFFGVSRCVFVDIDIEADTCTTQPDYRADDSVVSMAGVFPISSFGDIVGAAYAAGRSVVVSDVHTDPEQVPPDSIPAYDALGIRAHVGVPVVHSDRLVSCIGVHSRVPRRWKPEEVALLQTVVERTWLTVEVTRQARALASEAEATSRILESITDAFFALDADWRFTYVNDQSEKIMGRTRGELLGQRFWDEFPVTLGSIFEREYRRAMREQIPMTFEDYYAPLNLWTEVRVYPSANGLSVFYRNVNERKALEEERERIAARERNIAAQLQDALQPPLPSFVPGLEVGSFTRPALQEAQVGGDFFDIFPLDKELYAVVIGDVSGKGLAAAAQLALIRNSLRTTLYLSQRPAQAAASLNAIVTAHDLLAGFVTAFVGVYDAATGRITYASCGHEPGLVRRAGSSGVQELETTGPPLGMDQNALYSDQTLTLALGDTLLLYTDGLSEAGPSRRDLLGTAGLIRLFAALPASASARTQAETLVREAGDYAAGRFHDDIAVLTLRRV